MDNKILAFGCPNETISFETFDDSIGLPFPLNKDPIWRLLLASILLIVLMFGTVLRRQIVQYLRSPDSKLGPINVLIWMDQGYKLY